MCNNFQKYSWEQKNYCTLMSYHPSITSANTKEVIFIILFQSPLQKHKKVNLLLSIELMDLMTVGLMLQNLKESKQGRKIFNDELMNLKSRTFIRPDLGSLYPQDISHSNLELREVMLIMTSSAIDKMFEIYTFYENRTEICILLENRFEIYNIL